MQVTASPEGWTVVPPPHRFDIAIEEDLIEEVARIMGFAAIPERPALRQQIFLHRCRKPCAPERALLDALVARGYHETIGFAFVDPALQAQLFPQYRNSGPGQRHRLGSVGDARVAVAGTGAGGAGESAAAAGSRPSV